MSEQKVKQHRLESFLAAFASWTIPFLPRFLLRMLAGGLARLAYIASKRDRKVADANLRCVFGDTFSASDRRRITIASFRSFAMLLLDLFWFHRFSEKRIERYVDFDESTSHYFETKPAIIITAHFGNWEVMAQAAAYRNEPCVSIAAPMNNPAVDRLLQNLRGKSGQSIQTQQGAVRALMKVLRSGQRTGLLLDQNTLPADGGEFVDFMGLPAPVSLAGSMLGLRMGAPIMIVYCLAQPGGRYRLFGTEPFDVTKENVADTTQAIATRMGHIIKSNPEQWLWMYKRWKFIPDGHDGQGFPYYARRVK